MIMKFKGDIIITDPGYICKNDDWEKCEYGKCMEKLGLRTYITRNTIYGDWSCTTFKDTPKSNKIYKKIISKNLKFFGEYNNSEIYKTEENREKMLKEHEVEIEKLNSDIALGEFCADCGMVGVFLLEEVLKYNPDFDYHKNRKWTTTLIESFDGEVEFKVVDEEVSVIGKGNIDFYTQQTGF